MTVIRTPSGSIRRARVEDAEAIATVHVTAWRESYTSLMPAEMLMGLSVEERADRWRDILVKSDPAISTVAFVACARDDTIVGFSSCGLQRSLELIEAGFGGEFQAIYVLHTAQRLGMGRALMDAMARDLADRGISGSALWVLDGNQPAMNFYDVLGGVIVAQREEKLGDGVVLAEIAYGWTDVASLTTTEP